MFHGGLSINAVFRVCKPPRCGENYFLGGISTQEVGYLWPLSRKLTSDFDRGGKLSLDAVGKTSPWDLNRGGVLSFADVEKTSVGFRPRR